MAKNNQREIERCTAKSGVLLFTIGLFTGIYSAAALTGTLTLNLPRLALSAHLNALLGGLWLLAVAYTIQFLKYDSLQLKRLSRVVILPAWANWLITLIASFLGVNGLTYNTDLSNNVIAASLQAFVVLPALFASVYWLRGFGSKE